MLMLKEYLYFIFYKSFLLQISKNIWNFLIKSDIILVISVYTLFHLLLIMSVMQGRSNIIYILANYLVNN